MGLFPIEVIQWMMAKNPEHSEANPVAAGVVSATRRLLAPLIKLLISHGVTLPVLHQLLKSIYVEVSEEEFTLEGRKLTDSRVSLLTGVHRKDVQKIRSSVDKDKEVPGSISIGTRLVSTWIDDPLYLDRKGRPRTLLIRGEDATAPGFEQLVEQVSRKDLHPRVVLDELIRLEIVSVENDIEVSLNIEAFVPDNSLEEKLWFFGKNLGAHMSTGVHNLLDEKPPMLERSVSYSGLAADDIKQLRKQADQLGMQTLKALNREAKKLKKNREKQEAKGEFRFTFGLYQHDRETNAEVDDKPD